MIVFKAYAKKKKSYKLRVPQHDSFLSACIKTRTASVFLSVESLCEKLKTPWQCHSEAQRRARHVFGSQVIYPLLLHRAAVPTDLTQQQVKNLGPYGNVQSHVKTFCMSLARVMFTCIFPSPLSPFCLPHAFNLWQEGKRGTDLRFLTQAVLVPGTSVLSPSHRLCSSLPTAHARSSFIFLRTALPGWRYRPSDSHTSSHGRLSWAWLVWNLFSCPKEAEAWVL